MPLLLARAGYAFVGLATIAIGIGGWAGSDPASGPAIVAGLLALGAAAWVTDAHPVRGAVASVGIAVGAVTPATGSFLIAAILVAMGGDWLRALVAITPLVPIGLAATTMWRRSRRPWAGSQSPAAR